MTSYRAPSSAENRSLRTARTRTPLSRALMRTVITARRERSTAVTSRAPRCAARMASAPLPVHTSSTDARRRATSSSRTWASIQVSEMGEKTPGRVMIRIRTASLPAGGRRPTPPSRPDRRACRTPAAGSSPLVAAIDLPELDEEALRAAFTHERAFTVGIEEELMLLHPTTLDLEPRAAEGLERAAGDQRFKLEMPAAQLEIVLPPTATVRALATGLGAARRDLAAVASEVGVLAGAGVHPFAAAEGAINPGERYAAIEHEFASVARRQLVHGLHVHVAVPDPDVALAVYNALREQLPALAALGAASPFYEGRDTGLASARPMLCDLLPRQGVPPSIASWADLAAAFRWGRATGAFADASQWWWEARLHPVHGTIEIRVPDTQATVADTIAIAAVGHALVVDLAGRAAAGEALGAVPSWKIAENRWAACRHGVEGRWHDAWSGRSAPMAEHLHALLDRLEPTARDIGCAAELRSARDLVDAPRAAAARQIGRDGGARALARWLAKRFTG